MQRELASVLANPTFMRSPVLARLLTYLVGTTISGDAGKLKSYSVAVDGLGRSPEVDPQVDTYARVQVARLRKALDAVYGTAATAERAQRLTIDSGSYEVRLVPRGADIPVEAPPVGRHRLRPALIATGALISLVCATAATMHWRASSQAALARWKASNFPSATVVVKNHGDQHSNGAADLIRQELLMRIGRYQALRVIYDGAASADYTINVNLYPSDGGLLANTFVVDRSAGRVVWSGSEKVTRDPDRHFSGSPYIARTAFTVSQGTGVIHSNERRRGRAPDTPYGCWLRFTTLMANNHLIGDPALSKCAAAWHEAVPDHPLASSLYAWTLIDQSIVEVSESDRRELLDEALQTLESAQALNPNSGLVPAVAMRAYAIADEDLAMRGAADEAMRLTPGNLEIEGLAGTMLTFRNDPHGEALLDDAIAKHPDPPPWYFIAKFVAAMMREDTSAAGRALARLRQLNHTMPVVPIFTAAYEARIGNVAKARASWERAKGAQPILRIEPDIFLERTPLGPAVITKLKRWLKPALT